MKRKRTIIGLGEALLVDYPDRTEPAGLAVDVAMHAAWLGQRGVSISRVGQDEQADDLLAMLNDAGVETMHVQSDPDLPTGRVTVRAIGGRIERYSESRCAFDNLQWDFDLEDIAQQTDAVVFGLLTRRGAQTRSEEDRFLARCGSALKLLDLTNRGSDGITRNQANSGLDLADIAIVDSTAVEAILPGSGGSSLGEAARNLMRHAGLSCAMTVEPDNGDMRLSVYGERDQLADRRIPPGRRPFIASIVAFLHSVLSGRGLDKALEIASNVGRFAEDHPGESVPEDLYSVEK